MKILVAEDEIKTASSIKKGLEESQFEVDIATDGLLARQLIRRNHYELIISDIIMPGLSGIDLCKEIRTGGMETPILMLTALSSTDDVVTGLDAGADDYLIKPFAFKELLARVRTLTKRSTRTTITSNSLRYADVEMNLDSKTVMRSGQRIDLTAKEFALLEYLLRNQGKVISKTELCEKVWKLDFDTGTNLVEVYINYLRKKIDRDFAVKLIHNQFGMGYILKEG